LILLLWVPALIFVKLPIWSLFAASGQGISLIYKFFFLIILLGFVFGFFTGDRYFFLISEPFLKLFKWIVDMISMR